MKTKFFKRFLSLTLSFIMTLSMIIVSSITTSAAGTGEIAATEPTQSADGTYLIADYANLLWVADYAELNTGVKAELTADIVENQNIFNSAGELNGTPINQWVPNNFSGLLTAKVIL